MFQQDLLDPQILAQTVVNGADNFPLLAVPFFMLAGEIMNVGGLSKGGLLGIVWVNVHDNQMDIAETAHRDG